MARGVKRQRGTTVECACGCGSLFDPFDAKGRPRSFVWGHTRRNRKGADLWVADGSHWRTARTRSRSITPHEECAWERIGGCKGPIQVAHIDQHFTNNDPANLLPLCASHHGLLDRGRIDPQNPVMPPFYVDRGGNRRYAHLGYRMPSSQSEVKP